MKFLSHNYWPVLFSAHSGTNWVWINRQICHRLWYCFYNRLFTQTSGSVFPKVLRNLVHTTATGVSFPSATCPYSHSGFVLSDLKTQGMDINVYLRLSIIYSKGRSSSYEQGGESWREESTEMTNIWEPEIMSIQLLRKKVLFISRWKK